MRRERAERVLNAGLGTYAPVGARGRCFPTESRNLLYRPVCHALPCPMKGKQTNCVQLRASHTVTHNYNARPTKKSSRTHRRPRHTHPLPYPITRMDGSPLACRLTDLSQPHGTRFTATLAAAAAVAALCSRPWCSQVRRRRAPRGRLIQRVVDGGWRRAACTSRRRARRRGARACS